LPNGYSLPLGLNSVNPNYSDGWSGSLCGCEKTLSRRFINYFIFKVPHFLNVYDAAHIKSTSPQSRIFTRRPVQHVASFLHKFHGGSDST